MRKKKVGIPPPTPPFGPYLDTEKLFDLLEDSLTPQIKGAALALDFPAILVSRDGMTLSDISGEASRTLFPGRSHGEAAVMVGYWTKKGFQPQYRGLWPLLGMLSFKVVNR